MYCSGYEALNETEKSEQKNANACNISLHLCEYFVAPTSSSRNEWRNTETAAATECSIGKSNYNFLFLFTSLTRD
jgi:hypothetical protein